MLVLTGGKVSSHRRLPQGCEGAGREGVSEHVAGDVRDTQPLLHAARHRNEEHRETQKTQVMQHPVALLNQQLISIS